MRNIQLHCKEWGNCQLAQFQGPADSSVLVFQNGDYNKPIPAQYAEHLNQGAPAGPPNPDTSKTLQWVNCQMLVCKKCNLKQTLKIKQLASFVPREDVRCTSIFTSSIHYNSACYLVYLCILSLTHSLFHSCSHHYCPYGCYFLWFTINILHVYISFEQNTEVAFGI